MTFRSAPGGSKKRRMLNSGSIPPINPLTLFASGEQGVWFDPSDLSVLFQDAGGTTPVTAPGQTVGRINDKSGRGNNATFSNVTLQQDGGGRNYLAFNGTTSTGVTAAIDFTATDKLSVWAGVRKATDTTTRIVTELSASVNTNNGAFYVTAPNNNTTANYGFNSKGTIAANPAASGFTAPITSVLCGLGDISGDSSILRVNGAQVASVVTDQGTGNYGNYQLFIGARAGTSLFLNGNLYSLIVRGAASSAAQITGTESYVNSKTGAY